VLHAVLEGWLLVAPLCIPQSDVAGKRAGIRQSFTIVGSANSIVFHPAESIIRVTVYSVIGGDTMVARVTRFQANVDKLDEVKKNFEKGVFPAVKLQKGYRSGYLLIDRKTGNCISLAFWDTEKDVLADEQSGRYKERVKMGKKFFVAPPVRELYEVASKD
jgi:heme-degrading monooxygenase HmoA